MVQADAESNAERITSAEAETEGMRQQMSSRSAELRDKQGEVEHALIKLSESEVSSSVKHCCCSGCCACCYC